MLTVRVFVWGVVALLIGGCAAPGSSTNEERLVTREHYVDVPSKVPGVPGATTRIYVREKVNPAAMAGTPAAGDRVVLFIHGAGTPADVAFDAPREGYSWMAYLANAGFDVFSMDHTGYGRSTRPASMADPCNLSPKQQAAFIQTGTTCKPFQPGYLSDLTAEWDEINAVVDYLRKLKSVKRVHLIAWSRGGPRAAGFAARHPEKVHRMVLLAPAYLRTTPTTPPDKAPAAAALFNTQSREEFLANWDRQVGCPNQYEPATAQAVWSAMLASDPVGAKWGSGVRRAPGTGVWGWTSAVVGKTQIPVLMVVGEHDKQVVPERVQHLHADWASPNKVYLELACSSHNAMWERNRGHLFRASLEWLTKGSVNGMQQGTARLGD